MTQQRVSRWIREDIPKKAGSNELDWCIWKIAQWFWKLFCYNRCEAVCIIDDDDFEQRSLRWRRRKGLHCRHPLGFFLVWILSYTQRVLHLQLDLSVAEPKNIKTKIVKVFLNISWKSSTLFHTNLFWLWIFCVGKEMLLASSASTFQFSHL